MMISIEDDGLLNTENLATETPERIATALGRLVEMYADLQRELATQDKAQEDVGLFCFSLIDAGLKITDRAKAVAGHARMLAEFDKQHHRPGERRLSLVSSHPNLDQQRAPTKLKFDKAVIVYQDFGETSVYLVLEFNESPKGRGAKRLLSGDPDWCEELIDGLAAAGFEIETAACEYPMDVSEKQWRWADVERPPRPDGAED
jgi:hypothetical protein